MFKIPTDRKVIETEISYLWKGDNNIIYVISKKVERHISQYPAVINALKELVGDGERLGMIAVNENTMSQSQEIRTFLFKELPKYTKAFAIISEKPLENNTTNIFLKLSLDGFPIKILENEEEAVEWLSKIKG